MAKLDHLEPGLVWRHFEHITSIPHCSRDEKAIHQHLLNLGEHKGWETRTDLVGNIIFALPASLDRMNHPPIALQAHMDMVCEKVLESKHDFLRDPLEVYEVDGIVHARGTSLGADNGIGLAYLLALAEECKTFSHPPMELLVTCSEEVGLIGASELDQNLLRAKRMINLDTEDFGEIFIGCAGGMDTKIALPLTRQVLSIPTQAFKLSITGLAGGHSGCDINSNRRNSIRLLATALAFLSEQSDLRLLALNGGNQRNAIPREANAEFCLPVPDREKIQTLILGLEHNWRQEFGSVEPGLTLKLKEQTSNPTLPINRNITQRVIALLCALPSGLTAMSPELSGLVETSTNLGVLSSTSTHLQIGMLTRSSVATALDDLTLRIRTIARSFGAHVEEEGRYPGWKPNPSSQLLQQASDVFALQFGKPPVVRAVHAGLECGVFSERFPDIDLISMGPTIRNPHSPDEHVIVTTVTACYDYLKKLLSAL